MIREIVVAAPAAAVALAALVLLGFLVREAIAEIRLWIVARQCARPLSEVERAAYSNLLASRPTEVRHDDQRQDVEPEREESDNAEQEPTDGVVVDLDAVLAESGEDR